MYYRREVDGLRAVAVLPVILFHAGVERLSGGFIGVDVFFVISGYLITTIIIKEREQGTFTLAQFYERRARRILPALFFVILVCLPFAWLWMMPDQLEAFAQSVAAITLFSSNILFWQQSGYFAPPAEFIPLLHTWSLSVEEQYYLFFPLFILMAWRFGLRFIVVTLCVIGLISLLLAHWGSYHARGANFYLLPTRLWELLIGSLTAIYLIQRDRAGDDEKSKYSLIAELASAAGFLMIIYSIVAFDNYTPFPSFFTLIPTLGTALIILYCTPQTVVGKVLSIRLLVGIGLISYSAYLWHQPLFVFARLKYMNDPGTTVMVALSFLTLGLAWLSWKYIEQPFRNKRRFQTDTIFRMASVSTFVLCAVGITGFTFHGFPQQRFSADELDVLKFNLYQQEPFDGTSINCFLESNEGVNAFDSKCGAEANAQVEYLVWGDSFAKTLSRGFELSRINSTHLTASGCPPILAFHIPDRPKCKVINQHILEEIKKMSPAAVILHANWLRYTALNPLDALPNTISSIVAANPEGKIYILGNVPQWYTDLVDILVAKDIDLDRIRELHPARLSSLKEIDQRLQTIALNSNVEFVSVLDKVCQDDACTAVIHYQDGFVPISQDFGHLSTAGSSWLVEKLLRDIENRL